jgi:hypothetical protein
VPPRVDPERSRELIPALGALARSGHGRRKRLAVA